MKVNAILLKPLDGMPEGSEREFDKPDFERLKDMGAVKEAKPAAPAENKMERAPAGKGAKAK